MHEIVTLQLGQRSNYVATHFWNAQESYFTYSGDDTSPVDHDVHFRPGIGADGSETFMPRTLIYDLKGAFGSMRKLNALYDMQEEGGMPQGLWDGPTVVQKQVPLEQHSYQASLDQGLQPPALTPDTVRYWSDFNRVFYHPRSIVQLNEYELNSSLMPFERWNVGEELFGDLDKEHDLLDRDLRPFAEECDQLQGLQLMTSVDDAWGGFAARYMDRIRDEFGKTSVWVWGLEDSQRLERDKRLLKTVNTAQSFQNVSSQASVYIPICEPVPKAGSFFNINNHSKWHTSALISAVIESMTLPSRLKRGTSSLLSSSSLSTMEALLNRNGNQTIARLGLSMRRAEDQADLDSGPRAPGSHDARVARHSEGKGQGLDGQESGASRAGLSEFSMDLFPTNVPLDARHKGGERPHVFTQIEVIRGRGAEDSGQDSHDEDEGGEDMAAFRRRELDVDDPVIQKYRTSLSYPQPDSFPPIFNTQRSDVGMRTGLSTESSTAEYLRGLRRAAAVGMARDEREALSNALGEMAEAYDSGWRSGSDDDEDD
ncbi:MAG: hypothetical protein M4579_004537 [Chaenotheca gracillima]|nr:MAG: hypothetical protein M4579_004537 [Chaenotheca gracillima]